MSALSSRVVGKYRRTLAYRFCCRVASIETSVPIISFTFDDAPKTAFSAGGAILKGHGARATFFVSLGLLDSRSESGQIASLEDLLQAANEGHELGCHTFDHLDTWHVSTAKFVGSVVQNSRRLSIMFPGKNFRTFAYPKSEPKPAVKRCLEEHFVCCRGGGQSINAGMADLNLLKGFFLDRRTNIDIGSVKRIIDLNTSCCGWLVFATHDVANDPSPYGCTPGFFQTVVDYAARSGALLLPMGSAFDRLWPPGAKNLSRG